MPLILSGWMLARCRLCGAAGVHRQCGNLETVANWACQSCQSVESKGKLLVSFLFKIVRCKCPKQTDISLILSTIIKLLPVFEIHSSEIVVVILNQFP